MRMAVFEVYYKVIYKRIQIPGASSLDDSSVFILAAKVARPLDVV